MSTRRAVAVALGAGLLWVLAPAGAAQAHPLGNFTVNHADAFLLTPDQVALTAVVDRAEIPTAQLLPTIAPGGDPTDDEFADAARGECLDIATEVVVTVDDERLEWTLRDAAMTVVPGAGGLPTLRLTCGFTAAADLGGQAVLAASDGYLADRVGWREMIADGDGVALLDSPVPSESITDGLRSYPTDLLASPQDVRGFDVQTRPGEGAATGALAPGPGGDPFTNALAGLDRRFADLIGDRELTPLVGTLAVVLAVLLGCGHALLPGHGKSVMAAYLAGRRGRYRDAVTVGATVTVTHTAGVLVLGAAISLSSSLAGDQVLRWLGVASGMLVAGIGAVMLRGAVPRWRAARAGRVPAAGARPEPVLGGAVAAVGAGPGAGHSHADRRHDHEDVGHRHPHDREHHDHEHHDHEHHTHEHLDHERGAHVHDHGVVAHDHEDHHHGGWWSGGHSHGPAGHSHAPGAGRAGLIGMGVAGGLVPSPSALVVLIASISLGRTVFGVGLVAAYGLGMAGTLTAVGLLLVRMRGRLERRLTGLSRARLVSRIALALPVVTAALVLVVGLSLVLRGVVLGT